MYACGHVLSGFFFFFNDTATTEIYTLSLHDALPIWSSPGEQGEHNSYNYCDADKVDRKSTRLNSSHSQISYAVFCLKKNKTTQQPAKGRGGRPAARAGPSCLRA